MFDMVAQVEETAVDEDDVMRYQVIVGNKIGWVRGSDKPGEPPFFDDIPPSEIVEVPVGSFAGVRILSRDKRPMGRIRKEYGIPSFGAEASALASTTAAKSIGFDVEGGAVASEEEQQRRLLAEKAASAPRIIRVKWDPSLPGFGIDIDPESRAGGGGAVRSIVSEASRRSFAAVGLGPKSLITHVEGEPTRNGAEVVAALKRLGAGPLVTMHD